MSDSQTRIKSIFGHALDIPTSTARALYLDEACQGDVALRQEVEDLIGAVNRAGDFLKPDAPFQSSHLEQLAETTGSLIGNYKLLEQIGEGGMGLVYMAEQQQPVRRLVAIKIIKPGMDTRQVIARFEVERQSLAMMDHSNIAKVLDAGTTAGDRPYFVMDLVKGIPITKYCDDQHLTVKQRLDVFVYVCHAIQHAHQKGIIHRDIKPTNVLVALYDGVPVPKVIDFGVAKATAQKLTEKTLFTGFGQLVGTLEYMSPEQAQFNQLDIDTRSDIYSLGVLLYELLTGTTPLERARRETVALDETLRIIREEEPAKPSTRLSTASTLPTIAANRNMAPAQLRRQIAGDLDWIVMKCLEKDRNRRYETANSLANDLQRYVAREPVHACPPSATYRLKKFVLRHHRSLMVAAGLVLAVLAAAGSFGWALRDRAAREMEIARAQSERRIGVERQVRDSLTMARALVADGKVTSARERLLQALAELRHDASAFPHLFAEVENAQADLDRFIRFLDLIDQANQAETAPPDTDLAVDSTSSADSLPKVRIGERRPEAAVPLLLQALRCYSVLENDDWQRALQGGFLASQQTEQVRRNGYEVLLWLANDLVRFQHDYQLKKPLTPAEAAQQALVYLSKAETSYGPTQALYLLRARGQETLGDLTAAEADKQQAAQTVPTIAFDHFLRGQAAWDANQPSDGVGAFEAALRVEPTHYWSMVWLGYCLEACHSPNDRMSAVRVFTGCILKRPDHAHVYLYRGYSYRNLQLYDEAFADYTKAIALDPKRSRAWNGRAGVFFAQGRYREALADSSKAIELDPESWSAWCDRGNAYNSLGQEDQALSDYSKALELNASCAPAWAGRGVAYNDLNQPDKALTDLAKAIELNPQMAYAWNGVGVAHVKLNRQEEALSDFNKAIDLDPKFWAAWVNRGDRYNALGKEDKALADYTKAIELNPQNAPAWVSRAVIYNDLNQPERALTDLATALELNPQSAAAWNARGVAHVKLNQRIEALSDFTKAIELDPNFWRARYNRGVQYYALGQKDKALSEYTKAIELNPNYSPAWVGRAITYNDLSQPEKALTDVTKAIDLNPRNASAWNSRGVAHEKLSQREEALADFSKAIEISPRYWFAWRGRAGCYYRMLRYDEALADYTKCIELDPKNSRSWYSRGLIHSKLKQPEKALADYSQAIELDPRDATSYNNLAWQLTICPDTSLRDPQRALELAKKAVELSPRQGIFWHTLGVTRYRVGKWEAAIAALEKAKELRGDDPIDGLVLAMAHWKLGQYDQARLAYDDVVQLMNRHQENLKKDANYTEQLLPFKEEAEALLGQSNE